MEKPISKMTVKELQEFIREQTKITNIKLYDIYQQDNVPSAVRTEIDVLRNKGIISDKTIILSASCFKKNFAQIYDIFY